MVARIDGEKINSLPNERWRGLGMVSANNSSRLLLDCKALSPDSYWKILRLLFGDDGLSIGHLKIELGSDVNSSSGTESATMRSSDEACDTRRGAGFVLAADAKKINPALNLDMLFWSEPRWVSDSSDVFDARWRWIENSLRDAFERFALKFDYVSANQNERAIDARWIKYLSEKLGGARGEPYDFSKIKIVAADEEGSWNIARAMMEDPDLRRAVDVVGSHYTSHATSDVFALADSFGKEIFFSEGSPPMRFTEGERRFREDSLSLLNGALDIANRFITMYPEGRMTLCQYQPAVASYYDGARFCGKQFILADEPWSGHFEVDAGFFVMEHFSLFAKKGWRYVDGACFGDGKKGGDGHAIVEAKHSCMACVDRRAENLSVVLTNTTRAAIDYEFEIVNLNFDGRKIFAWETRAPFENYLKKIDEIEIRSGKFSFSIKPSSIVTLTTLETTPRSPRAVRESAPPGEVLRLPYSDDFSYREFGADFLASRGGAPLLATDQGGAFEVETVDGENALVQKIEARPKEWGFTPDPVTTFGDDRWFDFGFSALVRFDGGADAGREKNYAGVGVRYSLAANFESGYALIVFADGKWALKKNGEVAREGEIPAPLPGEWIRLEARARGGVVEAFARGALVCRMEDERAVCAAGRCAVYSAYRGNSFKNFHVSPLSREYAVERIDDSDSRFSYAGGWTHDFLASFKNFKRTLSTGAAGGRFSLDFMGSAARIFGPSRCGALLRVSVDKKIQSENFAPCETREREISVEAKGLPSARHSLEVEVVCGEFSLDGAEIVR